MNKTIFFVLILQLIYMYLTVTSYQDEQSINEMDGILDLVAILQYKVKEMEYKLSVSNYYFNVCEASREQLNWKLADCLTKD